MSETWQEGEVPRLIALCAQNEHRINGMERVMHDMRREFGCMQQKQASTQMSVAEEFTAALLARVDMVEQQLQHAPRRHEAFESTESLESMGDMSALMAHLEDLCNSCRDAASTGGNQFSQLSTRIDKLESALTDMDSHRTLNVLPIKDNSFEDKRALMDKMHMDLSRLSRDLAEERKERFSALAEVGRLTEDVAKAGAASIERVEKRFMKMIANREDGSNCLSKDMLVTKFLQGSDSDFSVKECDADDLRDALGASLATCIREVDAELRVELAGRINAIAVQLRAELHSEIAARVATTEARVGSSESASGDAKRLSEEVSSRISKVETELAMRRPEPEVAGCTEPSGEGSIQSEPERCCTDEGQTPNAPLVPNISKELKGQLETLVNAVNRTFQGRPASPRHTIGTLRKASVGSANPSPVKLCSMQIHRDVRTTSVDRSSLSTSVRSSLRSVDQPRLASARVPAPRRQCVKEPDTFVALTPRQHRSPSVDRDEVISCVTMSPAWHPTHTSVKVGHPIAQTPVVPLSYPVARSVSPPHAAHTVPVPERRDGHDGPFHFFARPQATPRTPRVPPQ